MQKQNKMLETHQNFEVFQYFVVLLQDLLQFVQIVFLPSGTAQTLHNNNNRRNKTNQLWQQTVKVRKVSHH